MLTFILVFDLFYKNRDNTVYPSLYPVLVILSRLYPSTMDGVDSVLNMSKFVPLVIGWEWISLCVKISFFVGLHFPSQSILSRENTSLLQGSSPRTACAG